MQYISSPTRFSSSKWFGLPSQSLTFWTSQVNCVEPFQQCIKRQINLKLLPYIYTLKLLSNETSNSNYRRQLSTSKTFPLISTLNVAQWFEQESRTVYSTFLVWNRSLFVTVLNYEWSKSKVTCQLAIQSGVGPINN